MTDDPFGTSGVRERVLAAWAASPVRFREDANAEEDLALGGYRDRLVVELAQNAADAAARAGVPGRLLLALRRMPAHDGGAGGAPGVLVAANTGQALDAEGVQALSTLRASAKRGADDGTVGRFGVGFSAVLAVSDEPVVLSRHGGVRFSAADTRALVRDASAGSPTLAAELARRGEHVPVLRLPFEADGEPPSGYDTAVVLPLRDEAAFEVVEHRLAELDDALLLALPALEQIVVERPDASAVLLEGVDDRWDVLRRTGTHAPALLEDRPVEERSRPGWSIAWAVPKDVDPDRPAAVPRTLHAPTPTDEPLTWPALLLASFPLDPSRRHVAQGPATDSLVAQAASAYGDLLADLAGQGRDVVDLVPVGLGAGALDGALRAAVLPVLRGTAILRSAEDPAVCMRPRDAVVRDGAAGRDSAVVSALAPLLSGLVASPARSDAVLRALDVPRTGLADVVDALPLREDPEHWLALYAALAPAAGDPLVREGLAALPVLLADGRVVRGARGTVLLDAAPEGGDGAVDDLAAALATLRVRAVDPRAAHPLLERLGAQPVRLRDVLAGDAVRAALVDAEEGDDLDVAEQVAEAVLTLVRAAVRAGDLRPGDVEWPADVLLRDADGEPAPAGELALPSSHAQAVLDPDDVATVDPELVRQWGVDVLQVVGVLDDLAVLDLADVALTDPDPAARLDALDGWDAYVDSVLDTVGEGVGEPGPEVVAAQVLAVRDLDAVRADAWAQVLARLAAEPVHRRAVVEPLRVVAGRHVTSHPSYTAWWLRSELCPAGLVADPAAPQVVRDLLPPAPAVLAGLDPALRSALGVVAELAGLDAAAVDGVLDRLADPAVVLPVEALTALWRRLAVLAAAGATSAVAPQRVRVLASDPAGGVRAAVVEASEAVVVGAPYVLQHPGARAAVLAPAAAAETLADLLDVPLAGEVLDLVVDEDGDAAGQVVDVPAAVARVVPGVARTWCEHERLVVDGTDVDWWVDEPGDGAVHACTLDGLARGLAWQAGAWSRRTAIADLLADPAAVDRLAVDEAFDPASGHFPG